MYLQDVVDVSFEEYSLFYRALLKNIVSFIGLIPHVSHVAIQMSYVACMNMSCRHICE